MAKDLLKTQVSGKHIAIDKAYAQMVAVVAVASFVTIFCLFAGKAAWGQNRYQARITDAKEKANQQLKNNIEAYGSLKESYQAFDDKPINIIGGASTGTGDKDGTNSKIILDALPDTYDFPALTSSIEKILADAGVKATSITGTDDQLNQQNNSSSPNPQAVAMPFSFTVGDANYNATIQLISRLGLSIRPIQIDTLEITGGGDKMTVTVSAHTYYQPAINLKITKQGIK